MLMDMAKARHPLLFENPAGMQHAIGVMGEVLAVAGGGGGEDEIDMASDATRYGF